MVGGRVATPYGPGTVEAIIDRYYLKVRLDQPYKILTRETSIAIIPPPKGNPAPPPPSQVDRSGLFQ